LMYFYSLSTFESVSLQYSDLPLQFFQTITASVPADFFSLIYLNRSMNTDIVNAYGAFPLEFYSKFLSIVSSFPSSASGNWWTKQTKLCLPRFLDATELKAILSHHFPPSLILMLECESYDDEEFSFDDVNDLLRECHVSSLQVPETLTCFPSRNEPFVANDNLRSLSLSVCDDDDLDEVMLEALSQNRCIKHLEVWLHVQLDLHRLEEDDDDILAGLYKFMQSVFIRKSYIKSLALHVIDDSEENPEKNLFAKIFLKGLDPAILPMLGNLSFFCVSLRGIEDQGALISHDADNVQGIRNWDEVMAPWLVLNFYSNKVLNPVAGGLVPLAVQAINWGGVYQHTTPCAPSNMDTANAGLIYDVLRRAYRDAK
jgi:hypothetical protein